MMAEDKDMLVFRGAEKRETQQRRAVKLELASELYPENVLDAPPRFLQREFAQVDEVPPGSRIAVHSLQMLAFLQDDGAAQDGVSRNERVPRLLKRIYVEPNNLPAQLLNVVIATFEQSVKEHAFLHRRQRIHIFKCGIAIRQRRACQLAQRLQKSCCEPLDHRAAVLGF